MADAVASRERALGCWRVLGDRRREGDTLRWLSRLAWFEGRSADAEQAGHQAVELLEGLAPGPELAMAYSNLSQLRMLASNIDEALAWGGRAIGLAERLGQTEILVHALNNVGSAELCAGRPAGRPMLERSLALALAHGLEEQVARAYTNLAWTALDLREYLLAARYREEGVRYCTERDLDTLRLYLLVAQARADFEQGRWTEATRTVEVVLRDPRTAPVSRIKALAVLGRVRARRGDPGVWPPLDEALALGTGTGELQRLGPVAVARAEAAWLEGDPAAAREVVEDALDLAEQAGGQGWPWVVGELAFWLWRLGGPNRLPAGGSRTARPNRSACRWPAPGTRRPSAGGRSAAPMRPPTPSPTATRNRSSVRR
jgi:tetratricopeptide (TPR) repeat protein